MRFDCQFDYNKSMILCFLYEQKNNTCSAEATIIMIDEIASYKTCLQLKQLCNSKSEALEKIMTLSKNFVDNLNKVGTGLENVKEYSSEDQL